MAVISQRSRDAALKFANEVRRKLGRKPVIRLQKGKPGRSTSCAIARTIDRHGLVSVVNTGGFVGAKRAAEARYRDPKTRQQVKVTGGALVADFIVAFDEGKAPDLVA